MVYVLWWINLHLLADRSPAIKFSLEILQLCFNLMIGDAESELASTCQTLVTELV